MELTLQLLEKSLYSFSNEETARKEKLLEQLSSFSLSRPAILLRYHRCLLFLSAHPGSKKMLAQAAGELKRVAEATTEIFDGKNEAKKNSLTNTGLAGSVLNVSFSFEMVKWLVKQFPGQVSIFSADAGAETIRSVFACGLLPAEADRFREDDFSLDQMIKALKPAGYGTDLDWLLDFIEQIPAQGAVKEHLYDSLKIFISIRLRGAVPSITTARSPGNRIFFHEEGLLKKLDPDKMIRRSKWKTLSMSAEQKAGWLEVSKMALVTRQRETDPITYADEKAVECFELSRGVQVVLFPMKKERRLAFESYIGYVAFKNSVPVAYGGGWIFLFQCKIGINIFPELRGGESAYLFGQLLQLYHQHFGTHRFLIEPYQIGRNNAEGIQSGAYWFYYRLGFRSASPELDARASAQFEQMARNRNYRAPLRLMKKLAQEKLVLDWFPGKTFPEKSAETLSEMVTLEINNHYGGKRTGGIRPGGSYLKGNRPEIEEIFRQQRISEKRK
jgi:hypothetical protein